MKIKNLILPVIIVVAALGFILYSTASSAILVFGGRIISTFPCCLGTEIFVGPPKEGVFLYVYGESKLDADYNVETPTAWVLGTANPGAVCGDPATDCAPVAVLPEGTISEVGTSPF